MEVLCFDSSDIDRSILKKVHQNPFSLKEGKVYPVLKEMEEQGIGYYLIHSDYMVNYWYPKRQFLTISED
jgi:F420-dependent methylenetetrahydromethanopterin dehydrogenase